MTAMMAQLTLERKSLDTDVDADVDDDDDDDDDEDDNVGNNDTTDPG